MMTEPTLLEPEAEIDAEHPIVARLQQDISLADGARRGGAWLAVSSWGTQVFQFAVSIAMARLLLPSQFGEAALVNAIAGFAIIFTDLGLTAAVIHAKRVTDDLLSTAFWLSALSGVALTLLLCAAAFPIAAAYGQPRLAGLFVVVSLNFVCQLGAVHLALLERTFHYRRVAAVETAAAIAGFASMPIFVLLGLGVYSIVLGPLVNTTLLSLLLWTSVPWRPQLSASRAAMHQIWSFSKGLVGFNAVNYWSRNLDNVLLGASVSDAELGKYNRSYNLMMIPVQQVSNVLMRGLYPALARMQDQPRRLGRAWVRAVSTSNGAFTLPITLTMTATAPALVRVLYGSRWVGMVPTLELLTLSAVPQLIAASTGAPYRAADQANVLFRLSLITTTSTIVAIVIGIRWGATGVACALLVKSWINLPVSVVPLIRRLGLSGADFIIPIVRGWMPAGLLFLAELNVRAVLGGTLAPTPLLLSQLAAGGLVFAAIMWRSDSDIARETRATLRSMIVKAR